MADKPVILVVDDEDDIRDVVKEFIQMETDCIVETACNGREALTILSGVSGPCLVLLDMMMPIMDGKEVLDAMRQNDRLAAIPVVVVSASHDGPAEGAVRFIRKPVSFNALIALVKEFVAMAQAASQGAEEQSEASDTPGDGI
ncbi:response regulator [Chondromyces apiculatus]|uniref:Response regulator n=1 Tax=Chondromyces apiculatus DSM 436 TaxID=1192034 RepID=A0A017SWK9_9BACT|nr:response regulator [Chondromyces apiculatus]EYF01132.1 response regulator [Chondromyces apiculatus DSM 436]